MGAGLVGVACKESKQDLGKCSFTDHSESTSNSYNEQVSTKLFHYATLLQETRLPKFTHISSFQLRDMNRNGVTVVHSRCCAILVFKELETKTPFILQSGYT